MRWGPKLVLASLLLLPAPLLMGASQPNPPTYQLMNTSIGLYHVPYGTASLTWRAATKTLIVTIQLTGLAPRSIHPAHIHQGYNCNSNGPIKYALNPLYADASGNATSLTLITNVMYGIPSSGWYVNVHNGPGLTRTSAGATNQFGAIACGEVSGSGMSYYGDENTFLPMHPTSDANEAASGYANMWVQNNTLYVEVFVSNLVPFSDHAAHIHYGSCQSQGGIAHMLHDVVANANGYGTSYTMISGVSSIPASGWYLNVHQGMGMELANQTGFDPIVCGDIQ